jgi:hypothetical protein
LQHRLLQSFRSIFTVQSQPLADDEEVAISHSRKAVSGQQHAVDNGRQSAIDVGTTTRQKSQQTHELFVSQKNTQTYKPHNGI